MIELTNWDELKKFVREYFPHGSLEQDNDGQLVIYTGLRGTNRQRVAGPLEEFSTDEGA